MQNVFHYRLKAAQTDLIERCGGIPRVAEKTGYSVAHVGRWNNRMAPDLMPHLVIPVLEADCGEALITSIFAEATGRSVSDPEGPIDEDACIMATTADVMTAAASFQREAAFAFSGEDLSPATADAIEKKAKLLQRAASAIRRCTAAIKAKGGLRSKLQSIRKKG
jgi:hypothetical protein